MNERFEEMIKRHSEDLLQNVVDYWDRQKGLCPNYLLPLQERWDRFIDETDQRMQVRKAA